MRRLGFLQISRSLVKLEFFAHPADVPQFEYGFPTVLTMDLPPRTFSIVPRVHSEWISGMQLYASTQLSIVEVGDAPSWFDSRFLNAKYHFLKSLNPMFTFAFRPLRSQPSRIIATYGAAPSRAPFLPSTAIARAWTACLRAKPRRRTTPTTICR